MYDFSGVYTSATIASILENKKTCFDSKHVTSFTLFHANKVRSLGGLLRRPVTKEIN